MNDKDLLVGISEMQRKQDQHSEILNKQSEILNRQTEILNLHSDILNLHSKKFDNMENTLSSLLDISITQFEKQQEFNEKLLAKIDNLGKA
jgi:hypothetical protein